MPSDTQRPRKRRTIPFTRTVWDVLDAESRRRMLSFKDGLQK